MGKLSARLLQGRNGRLSRRQLRLSDAELLSGGIRLVGRDPGFLYLSRRKVSGVFGYLALFRSFRLCGHGLRVRIPSFSETVFSEPTRADTRQNEED